MALIKCPECGKDVSDKAEICPRCGMQLGVKKEESNNQHELNLQPKQKKRKSGKFWFAIGFVSGIIVGMVLLVVICLIFPAEDINTSNSYEISQTNSTNQSTNTENTTNEQIDINGASLSFQYVDASIIPNGLESGTYKVGKDVDAGEYVLYGLYSTAGAKVFDSLEQEDSAEYLSGLFLDLELKDGQYIDIQSGILLPKKTFDLDNPTQYGIYQVGKDIDAGEYKICSISNEYNTSYMNVTGNLGAYEIADNVLGGNVQKSENLYAKQMYITLKNGQYLRLVDAALYKVN